MSKKDNFFVVKLSPQCIDSSAPWVFFKREPSELTYWCIKNKTQPPVGIYKKKEKDQFFLLWGYDIVEGCRRLGKEIICYVMELSLLERGLIHLQMEGHLKRHASEFISCIRFFWDILEEKERKEKIEKILAPFLSKREIDLLIRWKQLPWEWDILLERKHLPLESIDILEKFEVHELGEIFSLFEFLSWGKNKAMELLGTLLEISRRGDISLENVCRELKEICFRELSPADKISRILKRIRRIRNPLLFDFERKLWDRLSEMRPNKRWIWRPAPGFETNSLALQVRVDNEYGVRDLGKDLTRIEDRWDKFHRWYCGFLGGWKEIDED